MLRRHVVNVARQRAENVVVPDSEETEVRNRWASEDAKRSDALKVSTKEQAYFRIISIAPEWKQRNLLGRSAELLRKGEANLTTEEAAEVSQIDTFWQWVKSVRNFSDQLELDIEAGRITTEDQIRSASWPAAPDGLVIRRR